MIAWDPASIAAPAAPLLSYRIAARIRRVLHGASQRLVVVGPHTIASGYERRRTSQHGYLCLVGWLLMALMFGILVCAALQLPRKPNDLSGCGPEGTRRGVVAAIAAPRSFGAMYEL